MALPPWYTTVTLREEVREGRSFSPDEFAIALQDVVAKRGPADYTDPEQFFARTFFTSALREHAAMTLRRLAGETSGTAPVMSLTTQFGGGKTHTLTTLYHLASLGPAAKPLEGVGDLLTDAGLPEVPAARIAVFVGNAWDPTPNRETPWMDVARQLAGDDGATALGSVAERSSAPGTDALHRLFEAAGSPVLILFDEVLNFISRYPDMAVPFRDFVQNLTTAATSRDHLAVMLSLPSHRSEMTDEDMEWQERINKIVGRVAKDLIANDESEISRIVRRRLFEDLGDERVRKRVARAYAKWGMERSDRIPREWVTNGGRKPQDALRDRFEACYPFHPATLSVFQRKWRALHQFQQTRGALAMLARWVSLASHDQFSHDHREPLVTLGSAPLHDLDFRSAVLGQLGEQRLDAAIAADIAGDAAQAAALDVGVKGDLRDIHRRVGAAILFESSGGQTDKVAHLPELRFALGGPGVETTSVDNAAAGLERAGFFLRAVGADGYRIHHQATLTKAVSDRRASLDEEKDTRPAMRDLVREQFEKGAVFPLVFFPEDSAAVPDSPRLTLVVADPREEWGGGDEGGITRRVRDWTRNRNGSPRLYPAALVWCIRKPGRDLRNAVEQWLAWRRVEHEVETGVLGIEFEQAGIEDVRREVRKAHMDATDQVWASYRHVALAVDAGGDPRSIDLGAGHASSGDSLSDRIRVTLRSQELLSDDVGTGYIVLKWPEAFKETGAWPLASLRQSFLDGSLIRLPDPDAKLRQKIPEFVEAGAFGLAAGAKNDGGYDLHWFQQTVSEADISFAADMYLLTPERALSLRGDPALPGTGRRVDLELHGQPADEPQPAEGVIISPGSALGHRVRLRVEGDLPSESWNTFGTKVVTALRAAGGLSVNVTLSAEADASLADSLRVALGDLHLGEKMRIDVDEAE